MNNRRLLIILAVILFTSCHNKEQIFPDYEYQTVYFSYQHPVRTITLGEDIVNTDLDNAHRCMIYATLGGVYVNRKNVSVNFSVDNSLISGVTFKDGSAVKAMPSSYYTLGANTIVIHKDSLSGGVDVQLTDDFFKDPDAIKNTYVIPLKLTDVTNADSIISDKNYILYAVKYINPWHGYYLRRGVDNITGKNGNTALNSTNIRHQQYVEKDDIELLTTKALHTITFPLVFKDKDGTNINCSLLLDFDDQHNCTVRSGTQGVTATGTGKFVKRGEKNSWGNVDRDGLYLEYEIDFPDMHIVTKDTLVMRNRGVKMETF
ncbi:DUF5627 domain-containing protein [Arachidicoccus terrestris]|uniref:DUF5627 domain-containing protein n=1 Tax=Arachidicoccus terrestris TaxID=2875539 RepID=UPI001CC40C71|nr:DUF5627 domain-containing protein [Arachidicoccus terrestris]UAY57019.1 DUF5627 domain-containing protein [Arachidicoccus terrestris]